MRFLFHFLPLLFIPATSAALSISDFGAKGDGFSDDTQAIQAALDRGEGPVFVPAGRYLLTDSLRVPSDSGLYGFGTLYQSADVTTIQNATGEENPRNIRIEGVRIEKKLVVNSIEDGIRLAGTRNVRIHGVEVTGISAVVGILLNECENFSITNCYIHDFIHSATFRPFPGGHGPDALGISTRRCAFGNITGNRIENLKVTLESAEAMDYQTDGINPVFTRGVVIANNVVRNVGEGIDLVGCESCTVSGNVFEDCWHFGIKVIHGSRYCAISGNTIRNAGLAGMTLYFGNPELGETFANVVDDNTIVNTGSIRMEREGEPIRAWKGWRIAGIEIVNDNRPNNAVYDFIVTNNIIYDDQEKPTCQYGIIEREVNHENVEDPSPPGEPEELPGNLIQGNLIRGMKVKDYECRSPVRP